MTTVRALSTRFVMCGAHSRFWVHTPKLKTYFLEKENPKHDLRLFGKSYKSECFWCPLKVNKVKRCVFFVKVKMIWAVEIENFLFFYLLTSFKKGAGQARDLSPKAREHWSSALYIWPGRRSGRVTDFCGLSFKHAEFSPLRKNIKNKQAS